jgi:hypothetical protein
MEIGLRIVVDDLALGLANGASSLHTRISTSQFACCLGRSCPFKDEVRTVRSHLPEHTQDIYRKAFNHVMHQAPLIGFI